MKYLDQLFEPIVILNSKLEIVYYNHYFSTFSGLSPRKIKKISSLKELVKSVDNKINLNSQVTEVIENNKSLVSKEGEIQFFESTDLYNCVIKVNKIGDDEILVCFNDLSIEKSIYDKYRKQVEELKVSYKQLVLADKLKSIGELSAGISHEISNPLTIASGNTEILEILLDSQDELTSKEDIKEAIENIQNSLLRINKITINMKKFVHEGVKSKQFVSVAQLVDSSVNLVAPSFERQGIKLEVSSRPDISAFVDELAIEQVLVNILKNALDSVVQSSNKEQKVVVDICATDDDDGFIISVKDSGGGVSEDDVEYIFNPFFTTKEMGEGTGMGLSLSTQIIEDHQGDLRLESNTSKGCTFSIELPSAELSTYLELETRFSNLDDVDDVKVLIIDEEYSSLNYFSDLNDRLGASFLLSRSISKSINLISKLDIEKIILGNSLFSKKSIDLLLKENKNLKIYNFDNCPHLDKVTIEGSIKVPLDAKDILAKLEVVLGENHEEEV